MYIDRRPGDHGRQPTPDEAAALLDEARAISDGSARARGGDRRVVDEFEQLRRAAVRQAQPGPASSSRRGTPSSSPIGPATPPSRVPPWTS